MDSANLQVLPAPPSLVKSLTAGFDAISNHAGLILLPIVVDLFLWAGPRLRISQLIDPLISQAQAMPDAQDPQMLAAVKEMAQNLNLAAALRTLPVGIPSLMASRTLTAWAGGQPWLWQAPAWGQAVLVWFVLILVGLALGAFYFSLVGQAALLGRMNPGVALSRWAWSFLQIGLLTLGWLGLALAIFVPFSCLLSLLALGGLGAGGVPALALLLVGGVFIWLILPFAFSPHGIFMYDLDAWKSLQRSMRVTRLTFKTTSLFWLTALVLSEGLDILWNAPADTSWFLLIGMAGHAFITTALLAASFIYYRDANRWVQGQLQNSPVA
jgi:hypothetical protein